MGIPHMGEDAGALLLLYVRLWTTLPGPWAFFEPVPMRLPSECSGFSNIFGFGQAMPTRSRWAVPLIISSMSLQPEQGRGRMKRTRYCKDLPIGAGKKAKHTMVDKVVNTTLPPSCSLNPAASSTLMRPAESAASHSRCELADLRQSGQISS